MPHIDRNLIRKRAEHNEGIISTLEEISLHQVGGEFPVLASSRGTCYLHCLTICFDIPSRFLMNRNRFFFY